MATNRERERVEKKRREAQLRAHLFATRANNATNTSRHFPEEIQHLIELAMVALQSDHADVLLDHLVDQLIDIDGIQQAKGAPEHQRASQALESKLLEAAAALWERGWQPLDAMHVARRQTTPRIARLGAFIVRAEADRSPYASNMPTTWADQLDAMSVSLADANLKEVGTKPLVEWQRVERIALIDVLHDALRLLAATQSWRRMQILCDPPSRWSYATMRPLDPRAEIGEHTASTKTLATIRALLAKAEATSFPAEAESFAAKAQELMTRYSIDVAMLDQRHGDELAAGVRSRRVHIDQPYAKEKVSLLATVGSVNRVRIVFDDLYAIATAVGFDEDLDLTDMLFTSLLVQAARALTNASETFGRATSPAFRRAFWLSYAHRIGERLDEAKEQAAVESAVEYGTALVPMLQERADAVSHRVDELFGKTRTMKSRSVDAQGWHAGRTAADLASLGSTREKLTK
jgi:Protein of unknown function (DUF2786)